MQQFNRILKPLSPDRHVIGREAAVKLSEIEGLEFTDEMRAAFDKLDASKSSSAQRRVFLSETFGKAD